MDFFIIISFQKAEAMFWETIKNVIPKKASSTDHLGDLLTNSSALLQESYTERGNSARFWGPFCPCTSGFYLSITLPLKNSSLYSFPPWMCDKYAFGHIRQLKDTNLMLLETMVSIDTEQCWSTAACLWILNRDFFSPLGISWTTWKARDTSGLPHILFGTATCLPGNERTKPNKGYSFLTLTIDTLSQEATCGAFLLGLCTFIAERQLPSVNNLAYLNQTVLYMPSIL